jgi:hypothetical protein
MTGRVLTDSLRHRSTILEPDRVELLAVTVSVVVAVVVFAAPGMKARLVTGKLGAQGSTSISTGRIANVFPSA